MTKIHFSLLLISLIWLAGCSSHQAPAIDTVSTEQYKQNLGGFVCAAAKELNEAGILADSEKFATEFEKAFAEQVEKSKFDPKAWLAAKEQIDPVEHEKLMKLHFLNCLLGLRD